MYLSELRSRMGTPEEGGSLETISVGGESCTVVASGLQAGRAVYAPGGLAWIPRRGQGVLVVKAGMEDCIAGAETEGTEGMEPGEIRLYSRKAEIWLKNDGTIAVKGTLLVNGKEVAG